MKNYFKTTIVIVAACIVSAGFLTPICWSAKSELVLYFPLDEGKGNLVKGLSDHKHVGKFEGKPKWADGKFGKALEFDGLAMCKFP